MIRVYSIEGCIHCNELKELLEVEGIKYVDVDVNLPENEKEFEKVSEITKCESVPIIKVGAKLLAPDISFHTIKEAFELTKTFIKV